MSWLLWRQHRLQGAVAAGVLAALGILLWVTGVSMAHTYSTAMSVCRANNTCGELNLFQGDGALVALVNFTVLVPVLVGVFWGATIVGRELDAGTNQLVWTQSVTRRSWLRSKILLLLVSSTAVGAILSGLVTWWSGTLNSYHHERFEGLKFDIQGAVPVAYTLFAAALGLAAGVLWRRTLPAIATTAAGFFVVRLVVENFARPHFLHTITSTGAIGAGPNAPLGSWLLSTTVVLNGDVVQGAIKLPVSCAGAATRAGASKCLADLGYSEVSTYHPPSQYWTFQLTEAAIFLGLTAILTLVAVVALKRQDA
ncbi:MAG: hypothetical protein QOJ11_4196 [Frankiales bacterium]|jgi:hypothetical protein|nr:hypothetical protein [Frankiales bacterium]